MSINAHSSTPESRREARRRLHALHELLRDLFTPDELRRGIRHHSDGADVLGEVPANARPNDIYEEVVAAFERRALDLEFFEIVRELRPRQEARIASVAARWGIALRQVQEDRIA